MILDTGISINPKGDSQQVQHMGWEDRDGRQYYYRKKRIGHRVVSEYVGTGPVAEWFADEDEMEREWRRQEHKEWERKKGEIKILDDKLDLSIDLTRTLLRANLLLKGFHPHKGQWRKRRDG